MCAPAHVESPFLEQWSRSVLCVPAIKLGEGGVGGKGKGAVNTEGASIGVGAAHVFIPVNCTASASLQAGDTSVAQGQSYLAR